MPCSFPMEMFWQLQWRIQGEGPGGQDPPPFGGTPNFIKRGGNIFALVCVHTHVLILALNR